MRKNKLERDLERLIEKYKSCGSWDERNKVLDELVKITTRTLNAVLNANEEIDRFKKSEEGQIRESFIVTVVEQIKI